MISKISNDFSGDAPEIPISIKESPIFLRKDRVCLNDPEIADRVYLYTKLYNLVTKIPINPEVIRGSLLYTFWFDKDLVAGFFINDSGSSKYAKEINCNMGANYLCNFDEKNTCEIKGLSLFCTKHMRFLELINHVVKEILEVDKHFVLSGTVNRQHAKFYSRLLPTTVWQGEVLVNDKSSLAFLNLGSKNDLAENWERLKKRLGFPGQMEFAQ